MIRRLVLSALFLAAIVASPFVAPARADNPPGHDQQILIDKAARVVAPMRRDPNFTYSGSLLARAKAVLIVPELSKGGLIVGGQGGGAVLVVRKPDGSWSDPAFYSIGGGTLGLQAGFQQSQTVFFIMTDRARDQWINNQVKFGGQDGEGVFEVGQENKSSLTAEYRRRGGLVARHRRLWRHQRRRHLDLLRRRRHREILRPAVDGRPGLQRRLAYARRRPAEESARGREVIRVAQAKAELGLRRRAKLI